MISLRALFPAGRHRTFDARIILLDVIYGIRVKEIATRRLGVKTESFVKLSENVVYDLFFSLFIEHPDAKVLGVILFSELGARQTEQGESYLVSVFFVVFLRKLYYHVRKQRSIGYLYCGLKSVFVRTILLKPKYI